MSVEKEYKDKIIRLIYALIPNTKIILFGSRAAGTHGIGSDIDIALDAGFKLEKFDVNEVRDILEATHIPYKIDLLDYHGVRSELQDMIRKEGIEWKS